MPNEREVKTPAAWPTAPFFLGQTLQVVGRDRNTIIVSFFDGKSSTTTCRLEVVADDQEECKPMDEWRTKSKGLSVSEAILARDGKPYPEDVITPIEEEMYDRGHPGDDDDRSRDLPEGLE